MDKLAQRVIRPAIEAIGLPWYGWHGFRRGIASNLYALGAGGKVVQRILRHAKPHVTRERYIKVFDPAVREAMRRMRATLEELRRGQQLASSFLPFDGKKWHSFSRQRGGNARRDREENQSGLSKLESVSAQWFSKLPVFTAWC